MCKYLSRTDTTGLGPHETQPRYRKDPRDADRRAHTHTLSLTHTQAEEEDYVDKDDDDQSVSQSVSQPASQPASQSVSQSVSHTPRGAWTGFGQPTRLTYLLVQVAG